MDSQKNIWEGVPEPIFTKFFIDGDWREPVSDERIDLVSQTTEQTFVTLPLGDFRDLDLAVRAAREAFDNGPWARTTYEERARYLKAIARELRSLNDVAARLWTAQVAAPISYSESFIGQAADAFDYYGDLAGTIAIPDIVAVANGFATVHREPVGVAAIITPWNAPLILFSYSAAAALLAGCTIVSKPSPESPLDILLLAHCARKAGLPPGVLNVVPAGREAGDQLIRDSRVDKVSFTGSAKAGAHVGSIVAGRVGRASLELGGKSAAIMLDDVDAKSALSYIVPMSMPFSGQICFSWTRLLVPESRAAEIADAYVAAVESMVIGDPWDAATQVGPLATRAQYERVMGYIDIGKAEGAKLLTGGKRPEGFDRGFFVKPTVFGSVVPASVIAQEEIFGPVVCIIPYKDESHAVDIANDSRYGLNGAVFSADDAHALAVARRIRTGSVSVNTANIHAAVPSGGFKQSGFGRIGGLDGLRAYQEAKTYYTNGQPSYLF